MPVESALASYSDLAFYAALVIYLLAMAGYAVEYAAVRTSGERAAVARPSARAAADGGVATLAPAALAPAGLPRSRSERAGRVAVSLTALAAGVHGLSILLRGLAADRLPWGNMYEIVSAICFCAMVAWLVVLARQAGKAPALRRLGMFLSLPVVTLLFLAGTVLYTGVEPLAPALHSYWLAIHVTAVGIASGMFLVAGAASVAYLVRAPSESTPAPVGDGAGGTGVATRSRLAARLPAAGTLDRVAYRTSIVAFPIFTFAVICGAIWAEAAWGRFWGWDPKETVALVTWVVYACYLHARATAGWRGPKAAWVNVLGLATVLFNLFFVNMVVAGLHSYAGL